MGLQYKVVLQGLSAFERSALGSYFLLSADRAPAYELVHGLDEADFAVADADQPAVVDDLCRRGRLPTSVFVGMQAPPGAVAWTMRPLDPPHVLRELDTLAALHRVPPMASTAWPATRPRHGDGPLRRASDSQFGAFDEWPASVPPEAPASPAARRGHRPGVLLVDGGDAAADALGHRLRTFGVEPVRCRPGAPALERVARDGVAVVFIDLDADADDGIEVDGFTLCREVKRVHRANGNGHSPAVVLLSSQVAPVDRVRATLAGADAFVAKRTVDGADGELRGLLERHGAL
jgi:CheY-like chemotaxis protein